MITLLIFTLVFLLAALLINSAFQARDRREADRMQRKVFRAFAGECYAQGAGSKR